MVFCGEPANVPILHVGLPSNFDPQSFHNVIYIRVPTPIECGTTEVDDKWDGRNG